jgi:predicted RNA-binding protein YlxR (DUF448 family)
MQQKRIPLRMCTGCGEMKPKKELIRVVKNAAGEISLDFVGRKPGRGAYLCRDIECFKKARKTKRLERTYSCKIEDEIYDQLEAQIVNENE